MAIPKIKDTSQSRTVTSISRFLLLHAAILDGCRAYNPTNIIPMIIAMAPGIA